MAFIIYFWSVYLDAARRNEIAPPLQLRRWAYELNLAMCFIILRIVALLFFCGAAYGQFPPAKIEAAEIQQLSKTDIPTVSYCELVRNPARYNQKFIRVHGIYQLAGGEYSNLHDPGCLNNPTVEENFRAEIETWVWFDDALETQTRPGIFKIFGQLRDLYGWVDVIVVGKFLGSDKHGGYGHLNSGRFMLNVIRIEQVQPVKKRN